MNRALATAAAVLAGCYTGGAATTTPPPTAVALAPACAPAIQLDVETTTGRALVDGADLHLAVDHEEGKSDGEAVVYPRDAHSVLFAWTIHGHYGRPNGSSTLYTVDCATKVATEFVRDADGDFGHSVLARDGKALYYSAGGSVQVLDLATRRHHPLVAEPAVLHSCGDRDLENPHDRIALAAVKGYAPAGTAADDDDTLVYEVGDNCGFEGDWDATTFYLDHPERPGGKPYEPRGVATIAVDAGGAVYAAAGSTCREPGLWRSDDRGEHWARIALPKPAGDRADETGPIEIVADAKQPGAVLVQLGTCEGPFGVVHGRLLVTRDRGATWTALPTVPRWPGGQLPSEVRVELTGGSLDHPMIWFTSADEGLDAASLAADGTDWDALVPAPPAPAAHGSATARGDVYLATSNGLVRKHPGEPTRRLFPH